MNGKNIIDDLVYPDLSYTIVGCAYEVYKEFGHLQSEKVIQKAMMIALKNKGLKCREEVGASLMFQGEVIKRGRSDILAEKKVVAELKRDPRFSKANIDQVNRYLKAHDVKPAIPFNFTKTGVIFKRLVNIK